MNLSKRSQLYQIAYRYNNTFKGPRSGMTLCEYVECVFFGLMKMLLWAGAFLLWSSQALFVILATIVGFQYGFHDVMRAPTTFIAAFPFLVIIAAAAIVGIAAGLNYLEDKIEKRKIRKAGEEWRYGKKEPGLIRSYLKAIKDKVCPIIEFY